MEPASLIVFFVLFHLEFESFLAVATCFASILGVECQDLL